MKNIAKFLVALTAIFTLVSTSFAEEKKEGSPLKIKGKMYAEYAQVVTANKTKVDDEGEQRDGYNGFAVNRVYLTAKKKINDVWSFRYTSDIANEDGKYVMYTKYAYFQAKNKFGDAATLKLRGGMVGTPVNGRIDKVSGYRWVFNNFVDKSKNLQGFSIDNSADLGLRADLSITKMFDLNLMYSNGEGYKKVEDYDEDKGKAIYAQAVVKPFKGLSLAGYYRTETIEKTESQVGDQPGASTPFTDDYSEVYYGANLAWSTKLLKTGINYTISSVDQNGSTTKEGTLLDFWFNMNLKSVTDVPLLIMGRYAQGEDDKSTNSKTTYIGAGLGYQFNKNVKAIAYYETYSYDNDAKDKESTMYAKCEVKF